jgi:hypothetical protein
MKLRTLLLVLAALALTTTVSAAVPDLMSYQGCLTNAAGQPLVGNYAVRFVMYMDAAGTFPIYWDSQMVSTDPHGCFSTQLRGVNFAFTFWTDTVRYLGIRVGDDPELRPLTRLATVPYSIRTATIDQATGGHIDGLVGISGSVYVYSQNVGVALESQSVGSHSAQNYGFLGRANGSTDVNIGVYGEAHAANGYTNSSGIYGRAKTDIPGTIWAGYFDGWTNVVGTFYASAKFFRIDDPVDPANATFQHTCVESDEYKNVYDGVVTTDGTGTAVVSLPGWFEALNKDFRYQLTVIGQFAQVVVLNEISSNQFTIASDKPNVKVSWQVTGVRKDPYALAHPVEVETPKPAAMHGKYLNPAEYGLDETHSVDYATRKYIAEQEKITADQTQSAGAVSSGTN